MSVKAKTKDELIEMLAKSLRAYDEQQQELIKERNELKDLAEELHNVKEYHKGEMRELSTVHNKAIMVINQKLRHHEALNKSLTRTGGLK